MMSNGAIASATILSSLILKQRKQKPPVKSAVNMFGSQEEAKSED
ncbi:hypothetical protein [Nostoc sp. MG11]|nr:hypothetical protein [Nostoc sp. MG11]